MNDSIKIAIDQLYEVFKTHKIENLNEISCFYFGPSDDQLTAISKDLRVFQQKF
jgi:hypothetical protein